MAKYTVVMVRHGESAWNAENRFCGWYDADLAETGVNEAKNAGKVGNPHLNDSVNASLLTALIQFFCKLQTVRPKQSNFW